MAEERKISLKLLVDTKANKVIFAEAGNDFVDFLFRILTLPMAAVVKLLNNKDIVTSGSLVDLCKSIDALSSHCMQCDSSVLTLKMGGSCRNSTTFHCLIKCEFKTSYATDCQGADCPCSKRTTRYLFPQSDTGGVFVKGKPMTYMVMDNLEVKTMSVISGFTLIDKFNVKNVSSVAHKEVQFGLNEGIALLEASLQTKEVLTTVFL